MYTNTVTISATLFPVLLISKTLDVCFVVCILTKKKENRTSIDWYKAFLIPMLQLFSQKYPSTLFDLVQNVFSNFAIFWIVFKKYKYFWQLIIWNIIRCIGI